MAGHSKWANIQHRKGAQDAKRGQLFTKFIREITTAARTGGGDPNSNSRLRLAVDKALSGNMTRDTIERAIKRGVGATDGEQYESMRYEGYGPAGVAVIVDCLTDNRNRTAAEVRHAFDKHGGNLGTDGSVAYLFTKTGVLHFDKKNNEDALMEAALEAGADDFQEIEEGFEVTTSSERFLKVKEQLEAKKFTPTFAEVQNIASTSVSLDAETAEKMFKLIDALEGLDDVQHVYTNVEISDEVAEKLA